jgi:hypothetical protein
VPLLNAAAEQEAGQGEQLQMSVRPPERGRGEEPQTEPGSGRRRQEIVECRAPQHLDAGDLGHGPIQQDQLSWEPSEELFQDRSPLPDGGDPDRDRATFLQREAVRPSGLRGFAA